MALKPGRTPNGNKTHPSDGWKTRHDHEPGSQIYDADVGGLRVVVGKKNASYKLMGRINDGTGRYVSIVSGRIDELSLKSARERAKELRMILRRGDDPRAPKGAIPNLNEVFERHMSTRGKELRPRTAHWYRQIVEGSILMLKSCRWTGLTAPQCGLCMKTSPVNLALMAPMDAGSEAGDQ